MKKLRIKDKDLLGSVRGKKCLICTNPSDPAHIKSKGSGGDDTADNVFPLCRTHHQRQHQIGWGRFAKEFPIIYFELEKRGWQIINEFGRERLVRT